MPVTVQQIVDATIIELSQVPGSSTQIYATPRILQYVQDAFDFCFQQNWWVSYVSFVTGTLDGVTGLLTTDIIPTSPDNTGNVPISSHTNIHNCYVGGTNRIIRALPPRMNPLLLASSSSSGGSPLYRVGDYTLVNRPVKFYPPTAVGTIVMEVRQEPLHPFGLTDKIYIDQLMLVLGACYMYAADDGTNPGQINKFQSMFMKRLSDMIAAENDEAPLQLDPRIPIGWEMQGEDETGGIGFFVIGGSSV